MKDHAMNENDITIIRYLVDNPKSMGKIIAGKTKLSESKVSTRLNELKKQRIVDNETCPSQDDKNYTGKCWSVNPDPETLHIVGTEAVDHNHDSQTTFMRSQYYRSMIPVLMDRVCELMPLSDMEARTLKDVLGMSWLALKWVSHFISATDDERTDILQRLTHSTNNPVISPAAAHAAGLKNGYIDGLNASRPFITDTGRMVTMVSVDEKKSMCFNDVLRSAHEPWNAHGVVSKRIDDRTIELVKPPINWTEFFAQLTNMNENYPYLFE